MRYIVVLLIVVVGCTGSGSEAADNLFEKEDYRGAIQAYSAHIKSNPNDLSALFFRGRCFEELGQYDQALVDFNKMLDIDEKSVNARLGISKVKYEQGNYQQALITGQEALKLNDRSAQGHYLVARASHMMGYFDNALASYNSAIEFDRNLGDAYLYRGAVKIKLDKVRSACEDFNKARNLDVENAQNAINRYCR